MRYAVKLTLSDGVYVATCRDLPAFNSVGDSAEEALYESRDALFLAVHGYMDAHRPLPEPSDRRGDEYWVTAPPIGIAQNGSHETG